MRKVKQSKQKTHRQANACRSSFPRLFKLHPLFLAVGAWYCLKGDLFLFLLSALVAIQHECAHAFAAAKLGYSLNKIVLMPFGAIIDGDLKNLALKDEIFVAICGPLCNLLTALFFGALWWFAPTMYAFTDTAFYSSLSIAFVNLLPAYPLDGGRILKCLLARAYLKKYPSESQAEEKAGKTCQILTLSFALLLFLIFLFLWLRKTFNLSLFAFSLFLCVSAFGNKDRSAIYGKLDFSHKKALQKGVEIRRVAVLSDRAIKDVFPFLSKSAYLILEVYDENENHLFNLSQNQISALFYQAESPYDSLKTCYEKEQVKYGKQR